MLECSNHMAIVDISIPDINKFIATECRNVYGMIFFRAGLELALLFELLVY